jgi:diguanylate cyclase (GGDEF)-like protein
MLPHLISRIESDLALEQKLAHAQESIARSQEELSILYRVSSTISQTLEIDKLLGIVLETITDLEILHVGKKGGIMLVVDDRMHLIAHLGHSEEFLRLHKGMRVGDCLCGLAAQSGELIISQDCNHDIRHTVRYPGMEPHGHIIIPLHARGRVIGVLYLYCTSPPALDNEKKELLTSIGNQVGIAIENAKLYEETKRVSLHDPLTGLANRRMMDIVLDRSFQRARRLKTPFSAIMIDIDNFKEYNDRYGHAEGDRLLVQLAGVFLKETRKIDLVVRYGGEEFLVLLTDTDIENALDFAERMRKSVEAQESVTISLGVASFAEWVHSKNILLEKADKALYEAKRNGKNRIEISS